MQQKEMNDIITALHESRSVGRSDISNLPEKVTGKNLQDLIKNLKELGFEMDSADKSKPQEKVTLYKNKKPYKATFNKYSDGKVEVLNFKEV